MQTIREIPEINVTLFYHFEWNRLRGVPSHLIGAAQFEESLSDNSAERINQENDAENAGDDGVVYDINTDSSRSPSNEIKEMPIKNSAGSNSNNNNIDKYNYADANNCDEIDVNSINCDNNEADSVSLHDLNYEKIVDVDNVIGGRIGAANVPHPLLDKSSSLSNEIPPPPGAPRPENTARLRRYRLNLE